MNKSTVSLSVLVSLCYTVDSEFAADGSEEIVEVVKLDRDASLAAFEQAMDSAEDNRINADARMRNAVVESFKSFDSLSISKDALCMSMANILNTQKGGNTQDLINFNKEAEIFLAANSVADEEGLDLTGVFLTRQKKSGYSLVTPALLAKRAEDEAKKAKAAAKKAAKSA